MKSMLAAVCVVLSAAVSIAVAQGPIEPSGTVDQPTPAKLTDTELQNIADAVKAYAWAMPPDAELIKVFDRQLGASVVVKYDRILADPADCHKVSKTGDRVAVCAGATSQDFNKYILWFLLQKKDKETVQISQGQTREVPALTRWVVQDIIIKSVNGIPRNELQESADGTFKAVPVPIPLPAPAP